MGNYKHKGEESTHTEAEACTVMPSPVACNYRVLGVRERLRKILKTINISRTLKIKHKIVYTLYFLLKLCSRKETLPINSD
jgi:hypothetical protein